jgi:hypothetical protein
MHILPIGQEGVSNRSKRLNNDVEKIIYRQTPLTLQFKFIRDPCVYFSKNERQD